MHFIEHIIEPQKLLLAWQSSREDHRTRYIVAELNRVGDEIDLVYLPQTPDFITAQSYGFSGYPAFKQFNETYKNVLNTFMRRLPPRSRGDFSKYLENIRLKPDVKITDFALLGYSGAKLLSDGFSIIHPFNNIEGECELLIEAAGFRHIKNDTSNIHPDDSVSFQEEIHQLTQENAIQIVCNNDVIGYANRGLVPTFHHWIKNNKIKSAWIEKINGTPGRPAVYIYVKVGY